ncbi:hypothetical protein [Desulfurobacterium indicum]|uniref:Uncharacterized protein n=1 Tax=Desulfurobacterium indicum TaxID=1914305 RepID=A0A1R1MKG5_9BACT|nr:hypothetical protein [Desulfurobacterium indicum]OMH40302.1 hypothetical protein BLW93_05995 [Desulfurobacterium indicum]
MKNTEFNYTQNSFEDAVRVISKEVKVSRKEVEKAILKVKKPIPPEVEGLASIVVSHVLEIMSQGIPSK